MRRALPPAIGPPPSVRFPDVHRETLGNGLTTWTIEVHGVPTVTVVLLVDCGSAADPADRPGLAGAALDLLDEGAGARNAIELADAFSDLGTELLSDIGPDVAWLSFTSLARLMPGGLGLLADVVTAPRLDEADFRRVVELRTHQLQQRSRSAPAVADRALVDAVFGSHPYGHGTIGTTRALAALRVDDARGFWSERFAPGAATLIVAGDVRPQVAFDAAREAFGGWQAPSFRPFMAPPVEADTAPVVHFVDRPGAAQSELRVGQTGPPRRVEGYHGLVVVDAMLGGQFSSRINRSLREEKGLTYGARTTFGFRRAGGSFTCDASVQSDRTAEAAAEVLREFAAIREAGNVSEAELERAKASLARGYVRNFETAAQYARAAMQLATYGLDDRTFDRFVPSVEAVGTGDVHALAEKHIRPDRAVVIIVGDGKTCLPSLESLGRPVSVVAPEF